MRDALPNATFLGFTGTPVDKTVYGKGTFKTFGCEDDQGYLHKYSIADSIEDGTTLPLYYQLAPNEMLVPHETLDKEFLSLAEAEGALLGQWWRLPSSLAGNRGFPFISNRLN